MPFCYSIDSLIVNLQDKFAFFCFFKYIYFVCSDDNFISVWINKSISKWIGQLEKTDSKVVLPVEVFSEQKDETAARRFQLETQCGAFADTMKPLQLESKTSAGPAIISCCRHLRRTTPLGMIQRTWCLSKRSSSLSLHSSPGLHPSKWGPTQEKKKIHEGKLNTKLV